VLVFIIIGLTSGSLYGIAGLGLTLTYRATGVFNFAQGSIAALSAYLFYVLHVNHGLSWPVSAIVIVLGFGAVAGVVLEITFRSLYERSTAMVIVATVGLMLAIEGYLYIQFGTAYTPFPAFLPQSGFTISQVKVSVGDVITFALPALLSVALFLYLKLSRLGVTMRAVVNSAELVSLTGTNPDAVRRLAWILGSIFASLSGIMLAPTVGLDPFLLSITVLSAFGAAALGLFKSLPLVYLGGLAVGIVSTVLTNYLTVTPWNAIPGSVPFVVLIVVLIAIPSRYFPARNVTSAAVRATRREPLASGRLLRATRFTVYAAVLVLVVAVPLFAGFRLTLYTDALTYVLIFGSLSLLVTESGQISLCQAAFVAVGATTLGHLTTGFHLPWLAALLVAGLITVPVGLLIALPAIRLSGLYLGLASLGFAVLMQTVIYPTSWMFGAGLVSNASRPAFGRSDRAYYYLVLAIVAVISFGLFALRRGQFGRLLSGLAHAPTMLRTSGTNPTAIRLLVFAIAAFVAGIAGSLQAALSFSVVADNFGTIVSITLIAVLALGGRGFLLGAVVPAISLALIPGYITVFNSNVQMLIFGLSALAVGVGLREKIALRIHGVRRRRPSSPDPGGPVAPVLVEAGP
jgi:branched-subunit amino acid ABC-type transport system permease component